MGYSPLWSWLARRRLRILMYHSISDAPRDRWAVCPEMFAAQMQYLSESRYHVIPLAEAVRLLRTNGDLHRKIVLTFDDGLRDFLTNAAPILRNHNYPATLFIVTGYSGKTAQWSSVDKTQRLLSADELCAIKAMGFVLGSHTVTHPDLTSLDDTGLERELFESRDQIASFGETFIPFAYPGGAFTRRERDAVERAGYDCAVIVGGRWGNGSETDCYLLRREPMMASDTLSWFTRRVCGFYEWYYLWAQVRGIQTR
ncbi:MAG: polysaccharide deacetylase family protein [Chloroflexi bacterium]|nr:polysaccharide deacetylase family protein [Chloroflexota bacterium]